jgi:hypothetical protein
MDANSFICSFDGLKENNHSLDIAIIASVNILFYISKKFI